MELKRLFGWSRSCSKISYAQEGEDLLLERIMGGIPPQGFFVDIGAHHPVKYSNTYKLYKRGWRGLNIDAMPGSMALFKKLRPRDVNIEQPISDKYESLTYYMFNYPEVNTFLKEHAQFWNGRGDVRLVKTILLEAAPLADILARYLKANQAIDLLSIDVEGMDLQILRSVNFSAYQVRFIIVEEADKDIEAIMGGSIYSFLTTMGYRLVSKLYHSTIYQKVK